MSSSTTDIYVVLLIGLPGAGKSTVAAELRSRLKNSFRMHLIQYDAIQNSIVHDLKNQSDDIDGNFGDGFKKSDLLAWRQSRSLALEKLSEIMNQEGSSTNMSSSRQRNDKNTLIVMDDNFYLRSMRRDVYKVCQKYVETQGLHSKVGFSLIHVDTPFGICMSRNNQRVGKACVPIPILTRMRDIFEYPRDNWETRSLLNISNDDERTVLSDETFLNIIKCTTQSIDTPVAPTIEINNIQVENDRNITRNSKAHSLDRALRIIVGHICKTDQQYAQKANVVKRSILKPNRGDNSGESIQSLEDLLELFCNKFCAASGLNEDIFREQFYFHIEERLENIDI